MVTSCLSQVQTLHIDETTYLGRNVADYHPSFSFL